MPKIAALLAARGRAGDRRLRLVGSTLGRPPSLLGGGVDAGSSTHARAARSTRTRTRRCRRVTSPTRSPTSRTPCPARGLTFSTPEGWSRQSSAGGVTFTDKLNTIRLIDTPAAGAGHRGRGAEAPRWRRSPRGSRGSSCSRSPPCRARPAPRSRSSTSGYSQPDSVTGKYGVLAFERYEFSHRGHEVTLLAVLAARLGQRRPVAEGDQLAAVLSMTALLEARSLYRFFHAGDDETLALQGVSLALKPGELVAVTGPVGLRQVDAARLPRRPRRARRRQRHRRRHPDLAPARGGARQDPRQRIGMLFQQVNLVGHLSVADNVALAQRIADGDSEARVARPGARAAAGSTHRAPRRPSQLSGGELARAGLAVALANDPPVILADEPTGELDSVTAARVLALLRERAQRRLSRADRHPQPRSRRDRRPRDPSARRTGSIHERPSSPSSAAKASPEPTGTGQAATVALQADRLRGARRSADRARRPVRLGQVDAAASDGRA